MTMRILDHVGIGVRDTAEFVRFVTALGICEMLEDKLPHACKLRFADDSVLQLHEGHTTEEVKLAIHIPPIDLPQLKESLERLHLVYLFKPTLQRIDFEICGIGFHTVPTETHHYPAARQRSIGDIVAQMYEPKVVYGWVVSRDFRQWDPAQMIEFQFENKTYRIHKDAFECERIQLSDGRVLKVEWIESDPPQLIVHHLITYPMANVVE